jgi:hypothetical protein
VILSPEGRWPYCQRPFHLAARAKPAWRGKDAEIQPRAVMLALATRWMFVVLSHKLPRRIQSGELLIHVKTCLVICRSSED